MSALSANGFQFRLMCMWKPQANTKSTALHRFDHHQQYFTYIHRFIQNVNLLGDEMNLIHQKIISTQKSG